MKITLRKLFLLVMMIFCVCNIFATTEVTVDNINYILKNKVAYVGQNRSAQGHITIPETITYNDSAYNVTYIGDSAFKDCSKLESIVIPNTVWGIRTHAFWGCTSLNSINIPESVVRISVGAFCGCTSLKTINIPNSVTLIENSAFNGCSSLTSFTIPEKVTTIAIGAFHGCSSLTSITIPESVTSIDQGAFQGCTSLTSITIPNSVTKIWGSAFKNCSSLTSITIPNSVKEIDGGIFEGCSALTSIIIPNSVKLNTTSTFKNCTSLTSITLPESLTAIGNFAFEGCTALTSIDLPKSITSINSWAFKNCTSLTSIAIPDSVTSIGEATFQGCTSLTSITIPESVTSIGKLAFYGSTALTTISLLATTPPTLGSSAIPKTTTVEVPVTAYEAYKSADGWKDLKIVAAKQILEQDGLKFEIDTDGTVTLLPNNYTGDITVLEKITVNDKEYTVSKIGDNCFDNCSGNITLPSTITEIGKNDFSKVKSITINATEPPTLATGTTIPAGTTLFVPADSYEKYKNAEGWKNANVIGVTEDGKLIAEKDGFKFELDPTTGNATLLPNSYTGNVVVPEKVTINGKEYTVTKIGDGCFENCSGITSITLPSTITEIGKNDMSGDTNLKDITINSTTPPTVDEGTKIPEGTTITVPEGSYDSYKDAEGWKDKDIVGKSEDGNIITIIDGFKYELHPTDKTATLLPNNYTGDVVVPATVTYNGETYTVTKIGDGCFDNCSGITSITLPSTITEIGKNDMSGDTNLKDITINSTTPPTVDEGTKIPEGTTITVPEGSYDDYKNNDTWKDKNIVGKSEDGTTIIAIIDGFKYELHTGDKTATLLPNNYTGDVVVPATVTYNGDTYTVTKIGDGCFDNCSGITSITLPSTITEIGKNDMSGDTNLKDITINSTTPPTVDEGTKIPDSVKINVPEGSYNAYKNAEGWKDKNIQDPKATKIDKAVDANDIQVYADGHNIVVKGASDNTRMSVVTAEGRLIYQGAVRNVEIHTAGLYIVRINNTVKKILVK